MRGRPEERVDDLEVPEPPTVLKVLAQQDVAPRIHGCLDDQRIPERNRMLQVQIDAAKNKVSRVGHDIVLPPQTDKLSRLHWPHVLPAHCGREEFRHHLGTENERSEEHTSELQSQSNLVCRLLL